MNNNQIVGLNAPTNTNAHILLALSGSQVVSIGKTQISPWTRGEGVIYPSNLIDRVGIGMNNPVEPLQVSGTIL
jgi:hypothetical protein